MLVKTGTGNSVERTPNYKCDECGHAMWLQREPFLVICGKCKECVTVTKM